MDDIKQIEVDLKPLEWKWNVIPRLRRVYVRPSEREPMKNHRIGHVTSSHSEYDVEIGKIISKRHPSTRWSVNRPSAMIRKRPHGVLHTISERAGDKSKVVLVTED